MKLPLITLKQFILDKSIYRCLNVVRKDGTNLLLAMTNKGIVIVNTNCGYNYAKYTLTLPAQQGMKSFH